MPIPLCLALLYIKQARSVFSISAFSFLSDLENETYCSPLSSLFLSPKNACGPRPQPAGSIRQAGPCSRGDSRSVPFTTLQVLQSSVCLLCNILVESSACLIGKVKRGLFQLSGRSQVIFGGKQTKKKTNNPIHLQCCHTLDPLLHTVPSKMRLYKLYGYKN